jgi:very-short-patch-repair endonuclease
MRQKISLANKKIYLLLKEKAKTMRHCPTEAESILWEKLKLLDYKFRRQHIIDQFIVDFCCISEKLIIEVDGKIHDLQPGRDKEREEILKSLGFQIIRFSNKQILKDIENVIEKIVAVLKN